MRQRQAPCCTVIVFVLVGLGLTSSDAHAQAWVGDRGSLDFNLDYNLGISKKVLGDSKLDLDPGQPGNQSIFNDAGTTTHQIALAAEFVPVRRWALNVSLPFVFLKYTGNKTTFPHPGGGSYDNGGTFKTPTDLRMGTRYQLLEEPFALSPHLAVSIPVANYEYIGNSVAGRHLKQLHMGLGIGRQIGDATYVHLLYEFSLGERFDLTAETKRYAQTKSDFGFTVGRKLLQHRLDIHLDANLRVAHGGLNFSEFGMITEPELLNHDVLLKEDIFLAGGGLGIQISNSLSLNLAARIFVTGANTQNASVFALGLAWSAL